MKRLVTQVPPDRDSVGAQIVTELSFMSFYSIMIYCLVHISSKVYQEVTNIRFLYHKIYKSFFDFIVSANNIYHPQAHIETN